MLTFTRFKNGITRTTYPAQIEMNGQVLDVIPPGDKANQLVSDVVRQFGFLFPVGKKLSIFQVSQIIKEHSEDPQAIELADQLQNLSIECTLTA